MRKHQFSSRERVDRISQRIQKAGKRGISVKQIASRERISTSRTYHYLRLIRGKEKHGAKIERLDKKYYYLEPAEKRPAPPKTQEPPVELRGYINYTSSSYRSRDINIDCVMLVEHDTAAVLAGSKRIADMVERRFGLKLAQMLKFGVSPTTPQSANHFLYKRHGGNFVAF